MLLKHLKQALHYFLFAIFWLTLSLGLGVSLMTTAHAQNAVSYRAPNTLPQQPVHIRVNEPLITGAAHHAELIKHLAHAQQSSLDAPQELDKIMDGLSPIYSPNLGANFLGYGALIGTLNPKFVKGVLRTANTKGLDVVIYRLYSNPHYAAQLAGASLASADIQKAWQYDVDNINGTGIQIKQQSYALQKLKQWKKVPKEKKRKTRLDAISNAKEIPKHAPLETRQSLAEIGSLEPENQHGKFWPLYGRDAPQYKDEHQPRKSTMNDKALTLAALEILGASGGKSQAWVEAYMEVPKLKQCVVKARLNMEQCLAAGHFKYEDAFCVAQHELTEVGGCLQDSLF